jgi:CRISPR-associated protein Csx10
MNGLTYKLRLLEPLLIGRLGGDANSARSLPFVPGAAVRGALIGAYRAELDATNKDHRRLFLDGRTRYLHVYPLLTDGRYRGLPVPLSWYREKHDDNNDLYDFSETTPDRDRQYVRLADDNVCRIASGSAVLMDRQDYLNVHTQRDPVRGRSTKDDGAVFRYEAMAKGQTLGGVILTMMPEDVTTLKKLLTGRQFKLGKSRTAGYGLVQVEEVEDLRSDWREAGMGRLQESTRFTLTCLSDVIVRDARGQYTLDPLPALRKLLDSKIDIAKGGQTDEPLIFRREVIVGGFNRKWGLPLPQIAAIAAGSVLVCIADPSVDATALQERLQKLEEEGLGERRAEGFGRVAANWFEDPPDNFNRDKTKPPVISTEAVTLTNAEQRLAMTMLKRQLRRELEQGLLKAIYDLAITGEIPNSQLARWRSVIHSALAMKGGFVQLKGGTGAGPTESQEARLTCLSLNRLEAFRAREAGKNSRAWERMRRARIRVAGENKRLTEWIEEVLTKSDSPWCWFNPKPEPLKLTEGVQAEIDEELATEYRLRLLDGVLAQRAKQQAGERKSGGDDERRKSL